MRTPAFAKARRGREVSSQYSLPPPVGGWNGRDSIFAMPESDAVTLLNWFPDTSDVKVRQGWADHATGLGGQVESLMVYNEDDGTQTFFAAADDKFFDVTSAGSVGAAVQSSLTSDRWQSFNFTAGGTSYLLCFNGTDSPRYWDGSNWITVNGGSSPAITGITTSDIVTGCVFKRRVYLVLNNSLDLYYLPPDSVGGAASNISLEGYFGKGGYIVAGETWTLDAGDGLDDYLAVVTSEGQVGVFQGTNPNSAGSWGLKGVWNLGQPIGRRCLMKYRGDILVLTNEGVFPLSSALNASRADPTVALTDKIRGPMRDAAADYKDNFGWNMVFYPQGSQFFLNVPLSTGANQEQYVMNTITGAWTRFSGIEANCWAVFNEELYFGGNGIVAKYGGEVFSDDELNINTDMKQAFTYLGAKGRLKTLKAIRPNFLADGAPSVELGFSVDFGDQAPTTSISFSTPNEGIWDTATWDGANWGGLGPFNDWQTVGATGTSVALRMKTTTIDLDVRYQSSDFIFEFGGVIA